MNAALEDQLIDVLVRRLEASVTAASIVEWATNAMVAGEDTPSLVILAGFDHNGSVFETAPWLDKALAELHVLPPPPTELRRAYVGAVSRALVAGRLTSQQALNSIHQHAVTPLGHPPDLAAWCFVWEGLGPTDFRELSPSEVDLEARALAAQWAGRAGFETGLPASEPGDA